ncbi:spermine/spermidine synthase domain-containing protein [Microbulbifer thermotolerans]|uniref:Histidine kinase n=1 Tax=Microbulbifer thermotolerans TaxID=252514 RepID=A0A143HLV0_MICTH|nr:methyltransferase domain-containing protein [Microbulbifer thermotolerans]AMX02679.1 histidine kinase [Microbulbifer thermotolerans]MCX2832655.1 class I SAM-dependent methyltransferase [Microbulbifer thermotolerans]MCX2836207.1 class I SAM-dependent methyltransferase [Microbulbifer thermotolerans]
MALLWQKRAGDNHYQVRSHGASVRLYSNGVFHSQWNPRDPLKGSLWEMLLLPAFFLPRRQIRSVLLLGVGGGALIRLLQRYITPDRIVGVELDAVHLQIARKYFGVRDVELVHADARDYVAAQLTAGDRCAFDLIIDDLFGHCGGAAERAVVADQPWCKQLLQLLSPEGLLVANFGSRTELLASGWRAAAIRRQLRGAWTAEHPAYENCILAASRSVLSVADLTAQAPVPISPSNPRSRLPCQLRRLP